MKMKDKFGNDLFVYPINCQKDTLMACFTTSLLGKDYKKDRIDLRQKLLARFNECLNHEECYNFKAIHSFTHRLHLIDNDIPKSAEVFFFSKKSIFYNEGIAFIQKHQREGYISDKYIFAYLLSDLYKVSVHFFEPNEVIIIDKKPFGNDDYFSIYIKCLEGGGFSLLTPSSMNNPYNPPLGIVKKSKTITSPVYDLRMCVDKTHCNVVCKFAPPFIVGDRVHICIAKETKKEFEYVAFPIKNIWSEILKPNEILYIYDKDVKLLSCVSHHGKTNPYFYLPEMNECILYIIIDTTEENALKSLKFELNRKIK